MKNLHLIWPFACLLFISATYTLLAYRGDGLTIGGDALIPFHPTQYLQRLLYATDPWAGFELSLPSIFALPPLPDILLFSAFSSLNFDIYFGNKLYVFVLATLSAASIFYLSTTVFRENRNKILIGIVSAIAFVYSPLVYADTYKTMVFMELSLVQTGFILFMAFIIRYFQTVRIRYSIYAGLSSFLMFSYPGISAYRLAFLALFGFLAVAFYYLAKGYGTSWRARTSVVLKAFAIVVVLGFLLSSYWLIPFLQNAGTYSSFASEFQTIGTFNEFSNMVNTLRLLSSWSFHAGFVPYANVYFENPIVIVLTFAWPIFAFLPLLSREVTKSHKVIALYLATVLTILLAWGSESPFAQLYMGAVNIRIGPYYFLRPFYNTAIFTQLVLTVEYALLIGLFSTLLFSRLAKSGGKIFGSKRVTFAASAILVIAVITSSSWPMLTGDVMRNWYDPSQFGVKIPAAYWEANQYFERAGDLDHKTILLPRPDVYVGTSWGYQGTSNFYNLMFTTPLITGNEIPYGISLNRTAIDSVYAVPYTLTDQNGIVDVLNATGQVTAWQGDTVEFDNGLLAINFSNVSQGDKWHQVELRFLSAQNWANLTHLILRLTGEMEIERFNVGVGDLRGYVGWWNLGDRVYRADGNDYIPVEVGKAITPYDGAINLLLEVRKPDWSNYEIGNVASVWMQYYVTSNSSAFVEIEGIQAVKAGLNPAAYAELLAENKVRFLLVDTAMVEGVKIDPSLWLQMLNKDEDFMQVWHDGALYIFENSLA